MAPKSQKIARRISYLLSIYDDRDIREIWLPAFRNPNSLLTAI